ncbi:MAG TPA: helix-turn-helix domain-containing protein [Hyphomicrobiaceae bacterium]|nr:helix-turn-helix domain-containing protein [Hyphomicrobiaceae bacterium]
MPGRSASIAGGLACAFNFRRLGGDASFLRRLRLRTISERPPAVLEIKSVERSMAGEALNERERDVLNWVATGKSDWQVAQILSVSPKTVNYHVENAKRKLGAMTRIQAVVEAVRLGLIDGRGGE